MSGNRVLAVWLYGRHVADLERLPSAQLRLRFTAQAITVFGLGRAVLSVSLPTTTRRVAGRPVVTWFDHLLPEGQVRSALELEHGVGPGDTFGLLAQIGADCAGAVQLLAPGIPPQPAAGELVTLSSAEFDRLILGLPTWAGAVPAQASLGGVQAKALLALTPDGTWAIPRAGAPSTHIIKPEPVPSPGGPAGLVAAEHWCLQVAAAAGIPAASSQLIAVQSGGSTRQAIVITRYDRTLEHGSVVRTHQEDFAQALGIPSAAKYETTATGRLAAMAALLLRAEDPAAEQLALLRLAATNIALGNGDAHAKNYSLLINPAGAVRVAPLYDAAPLWYLNRIWRATGFAINGQTRIELVTIDHLIAEALSWGIPAAQARSVVTETYDALAAAAANTPPPTPHPELPGQVTRRILTELASATTT